MAVYRVKERTVPRILITEHLAQEGLDLLRRELPEAWIDQRIGFVHAQLRAVLGGYTVLIVDSATHVTDDLLATSPRLQLIGRAGSSVDNIDLAAASNSRFVGVELANKTLGILGLGKVGREVARLAQAFSMRVLGYDPDVAVGQAQRAGMRMLSKAEVLQQADFVMLHTVHSAGASEAAMRIGAREMRLLKSGASLVNCAGGRVIDEAALLTALDQGRLAGAALDAFSQQPIGDDSVLQRLLAHETPHLGAWTREAQARVATELARNVVSTLRGDTLIGAILPSFPPMAPP
jgi:D-3-phosphoglycerate dehydrogenase / 2-oxoglutarate reductase